jgi:ribosomal protein L11
MVGKVTRAQVAEIAKKKLPDTNATKVCVAAMAVGLYGGTCRAVRQAATVD